MRLCTAVAAAVLVIAAPGALALGGLGRSPVLAGSSGEAEVDLFSMGFDVGSNGPSWGDYALYNGEFLSDQDKRDLLGSVPGSGLRVLSFANLGGGSTIFGRTGIAVRARAGENARMPKDVLDLMLMGNEVGRTYHLDNTAGEALALLEAEIFYSREVGWLGGGTFVGGAAKYLHGMAYGGITEACGSLYSGADELTGDGRVVVRTARGGKGYSFDLGATHLLYSDIAISLYVVDAFSSISWDRGCREEINTFLLDDVVLGSEDPDSLVTAESESRPIGAFSTGLKPQLRIALSKSRGRNNFGLAYRQGLGDGALTSGHPEILVWAGRDLSDWFGLEGCLGWDGIAGVREGFQLRLGSQTRFRLGLGFAPSPLPSSMKRMVFDLAVTRVL
jgi:hypothetical protein